MVKDEEVARRIARAVVSDIALYNAARVEEGISKDNLFELLREEIDEGRNYYNSRIDPELARANHFNEALIDVLIKPLGGIPSKAW